MPNRLLKEGICTSDAINMLSSDGEVFFYRLLVVSDDFGNMDGRPAIIKSMCFPLKENVTVKLISLWITQLEKASLIQRYKTQDEKEYISILKWSQRIRAKSKYPLPCDGEMMTNDSNPPLGVGVGVGVGVGDWEKHMSEFSDSFSIFWNQYPKKVGKQKALEAWKRKKPHISQVLVALKWQIESDQWKKGFIPNPSTYLNEGRWEDPDPSDANGSQPRWYDSDEATITKARELQLFIGKEPNIRALKIAIQGKLNEIGVGQ